MCATHLVCPTGHQTPASFTHTQARAPPHTQFSNYSALKPVSHVRTPVLTNHLAVLAHISCCTPAAHMPLPRPPMPSLTPMPPPPLFYRHPILEPLKAPSGSGFHTPKNSQISVCMHDRIEWKGEVTEWGHFHNLQTTPAVRLRSCLTFGSDRHFTQVTKDDATPLTRHSRLHSTQHSQVITITINEMRLSVPNSRITHRAQKLMQPTELWARACPPRPPN
jgi:hypothetical protein